MLEIDQRYDILLKQDRIRVEQWVSTNLVCLTSVLPSVESALLSKPITRMEEEPQPIRHAAPRLSPQQRAQEALLHATTKQTQEDNGTIRRHLEDSQSI